MSRPSLYKFRLYVAGNTPNSVQAKINLNALCRRYLEGRYTVEVVDVARHPDRALVEGIYITPTLLKLAPSPVCMIVGTLSHLSAVLTGLGLPDTADT